jgi:hypothetical protein
VTEKYLLKFSVTWFILASGQQMISGGSRERQTQSMQLEKLTDLWFSNQLPHDPEYRDPFTAELVSQDDAVARFLSDCYSVSSLGVLYHAMLSEVNTPEQLECYTRPVEVN